MTPQRRIIYAFLAIILILPTLAQIGCQRQNLPPEFSIISPMSGKVSGTVFFAVQPLQPDTISKVTFKAGDKQLGIDSTPGDGFKVFLVARDFPAGPLQLSATATGTTGAEATKTITVQVEPNPPSSASVGAEGATLATTTGSTIVVPLGGISGQATISVQEKTQEQVTVDTGIQWDKLGVTFLGAQTIASDVTITKPVGVTTVGFGNRVQPGQAIVNYQILPDADGDGMGELVVANTASLAPNGDVVSDPVPGVAVFSIQTVLQPGGRAQAPDSGNAVKGPPGTFIQMQGTGFNPASLNGNVAIFRSKADGKELIIPGPVTPVSNSSLRQTLTALIPPLPAGEATLILRNESTGSMTAPLNITIEPSPPLTAKPAEIIDKFFSQSLTFLRGLPRSSPESGKYLDQAIAELTKAQQLLPQLANDSTPEVQALLNDTAAVIQNSGVLSPPKSDPWVQVMELLSLTLKGVGAAIGVAVAVAGGVAAAPYWAVVAAILPLVGIYCDILVWIEKNHGLPCLPAPSFNRFAYGLGILPVTTGMGAAPPAGGSGCGSIVVGGGKQAVTTPRLRMISSRPNDSDPSQPATQAQTEPNTLAGRYAVKIYSDAVGGGQRSAFTGITDTGGYFFTPLIPAGEPFAAVARDRVTREERNVSSPVRQLGWEFRGALGWHPLSSTDRTD